MNKKITKKDLKKINPKHFQHTKDCVSYFTGGVALGNDKPNNRQVWKCSKDCPLKDK